MHDATYTVITTGNEHGVQNLLQKQFSLHVQHILSINTSMTQTPNPGPLDPLRWRYYVPLTCRKPITQWCNIILQKTEVLKLNNVKTSGNCSNLQWETKFNSKTICIKWCCYLRHAQETRFNCCIPLYHHQILLPAIVIYVCQKPNFHIHYIQDRQCTYKHNIEACSCNHWCCGKTIKYDIP